jgi:hypothetical protein
MANPGSMRSCDEALAQYAVEYRCPGEYPPKTPGSVAKAMTLADQARAKIRT